ncbi:MAG: hypothetical protein ACPGWR_09170 [Ardenticatenaceae bacterium]
MRVLLDEQARMRVLPDEQARMRVLPDEQAGCVFYLMNKQDACST